MNFAPPHSHPNFESYSRRLERGVYARDGLDDYNSQNEERDGPAEYSLQEYLSVSLTNRMDVQKSAVAAS